MPTTSLLAPASRAPEETTAPTSPLPLLYAGREYVIRADGSTTTCVWKGTSPVKEYSPDD